LQYRNKSANAALRREQSVALLALCREARVPSSSTTIWGWPERSVRTACTLAANDISIAAARAQLGEDRLLGVSCYDRLDLALAAREAGADYVAFGSAFPSATKPEATRAPLSLYREASARLDSRSSRSGASRPKTRMPFIEAGADAVAVISALFDAPDIEAAARSFSRLFDKKNP